ncbi:P-loop containing nucleoside triphosphate hydrolase protein [Cytidiella melzeri]|nr:P-loop containing nucleoside triphosphate hydrolase protein [Cytidiella melzeri]
MSFETSHSATSDEFEALPDNGSVGLSDPQFSSSRRQMLDLINRLQSTGVQADMDLPTIAVIGSQSAGKSSLIESISGITLPRASGTCTRCPTECRLSSSDEEWRCLVSLRFTTDSQGKPLGQARNESFGEVIFDKSQVEDRIRRAQRAILNPNTDSVKFLEYDRSDSSAAEVAFSMNCICLHISGKNVADLSFVDLPGMIASGSDKDIIETLVTTYIKKPSCIILLTVACETDWENQRGFDLAQKYDRDGKRTVGVLTKPDRIDRGDHERWIRFVKNEMQPLENGWFSVKQPDTQAVQEGITWEEARVQEETFFAQVAPWAGLDAGIRHQLGTSNLTERLSFILSALIAKRLPELRDELQKLIQQTEEALRQLPKPPSSDPQREILHLVSDFMQDLSRHLEGTPGESGLLQEIRPVQVAFKKAIRATAPNFRASNYDEDDSDDESENRKASRDFLANEEDAKSVVHGSREAINISDVMERASQAITRELPDHYPFVVSKEYIALIIAKWESPCRTLFDTTMHILLAHVKKVVARHFGTFTHGNLQHQVMAILSEHLAQCGTTTMKQLEWLLELEKQPRTLNDHYYSDYKDKFLALYRGSRQSVISAPLVDKLGRYSASVSSTLYRSTSDVAILNGTNKALAGLSEIGLTVKAPELMKLLPPDPLEPALQIMATVRAYFQVAYKRFVDNVPNAIDYDIILGINRDRRLEDALYKGLGITGADAGKRCSDYLAEPPQIVTRRRDLQKRRERLESAKKELMDLWL